MHIVLPPQRVQPRTGPSDLPRHQRKRDQAARIIGAVDVLRNAHAPENHRRIGPRKGPRHIAQHLRVDAADLGHFLGGKGFQVGFLDFPVFGVSLDILLIEQLFLDDHMHDRV